MSYTAKSVIFDIANGYGGTPNNVLALRAVEFFLSDVLVEVLSSNAVAYATTQFSISYQYIFPFDTSLSKLGSYVGTEWLSAAASLTNQRLICVFGTEIEFDEIRVNNAHYFATQTTQGIKDTKIYISSDAITSTVYASAIANSNLIFDGTIDEHTAVDEIDDQVLTLIVPWDGTIDTPEMITTTSSDSDIQIGLSMPEAVVTTIADSSLFVGVLIVTPEILVTTGVVSDLQLNINSAEAVVTTGADSDIQLQLDSLESLVTTSALSGIFVGRFIPTPEVFVTTLALSDIQLQIVAPETIAQSEIVKDHLIYTTGRYKILPSLGDQDSQYNIFTIRDSYIFALVNQYGTYLESLQGLLNEVKGVYEDRTSPYFQSLNGSLAINDPIGSSQQISTAFGIDHSVFNLLNVLSEGLQAVHSIALEIKGVYEGRTSPYFQSLVGSLSINDPLNSIQSAINSIQLEGGIFLNNITLSEGLNDIQSIVTKLLNMDPVGANTYICTSIVLDQAISSLQGTLSEGFETIHSIENQISSSVGQNQKIVLDLSNLSDLFQVTKIFGSLYDVPTQFSSIGYKIYLDGSDISRLVKGDIKIEKSQSNIHNAISFSSVSDALFNKADPGVLFGEARIEVQIGSAVMYFLLEERSHISSGEVSYWGRDITAKDNSPYAASISVSLSEGILAKELCESLTMFSVIDWDILDWVLPNTFETTGTPVEILSTIASELGTIVRAQDDGSLNVRYVNPVRPVNLSLFDPVYSYPNNIIYNVNYSEEFGAGYNCVTVTADTNDKIAPMLEVEDAIGNTRIIGETSYIRAYYYEDPIILPSVLTQDKTDGVLTFLNVNTEEIIEIITFRDGKGSSSYPLKTIKEISWLGRTNSIIAWEEYTKEITLETESNCLAEITYDSEYYRYKAFGHNVEELLTIFEIESSFKSSVKVITSGEEKEGTEILTNYLTAQSTLVKRGEIWIDQNKYNEETISFESPYTETVKDGNVIWLDADRITSGKYQVYDVSILIRGPKVVNTMTVKRWEI